MPARVGFVRQGRRSGLFGFMAAWIRSRAPSIGLLGDGETWVRLDSKHGSASFSSVNLGGLIRATSAMVAKADRAGYPST